MHLTRRQFLTSAAILPVTVGFASSASATTHDVIIQGFAFSPSTLTISAGDTVRWTNQDGAPHTATFSSGGLDTGRLNNGDTGELTFATAGSFDYRCAFHGSMRATIVVS